MQPDTRSSHFVGALCTGSPVAAHSKPHETVPRSDRSRYAIRCHRHRSITLHHGQPLRGGDGWTLSLKANTPKKLDSGDNEPGTPDTAPVRSGAREPLEEHLSAALARQKSCLLSFDFAHPPESHTLRDEFRLSAHPKIGVATKGVTGR